MRKQHMIMFTADVPRIDIKKFAMVILRVTNIQSSEKNSILRIRTMEGTNKVMIVFDPEKIKGLYLQGIFEDAGFTGFEFEKYAIIVIEDSDFEKAPEEIMEVYDWETDAVFLEE